MAQDLWDAVRLRQGALKLHQPSDKIWDRRRPRTLFSGLMTCGCYGGGYSKVSQTAFGCSRARNKGASVCTNKRTISQTELEARVLKALDAHLMDAPALKIFCEEYVRERNRLQQEAAGNRALLEKRLSKVQSDHQKLVDAILQGIPATQLKDRMAELTQERQDLEQQLSQSEAPSSLVYHPSMAETYRARVTRLISELGAHGAYNETWEALRGLIDRIVLTPSADGEGMEIELCGDLGGLLRLASGAGDHSEGACAEATDIAGKIMLVAGARFGHCFA